MKLRTFQMRILLWTWTLLLMALAVVFYYSTSLVGDDLLHATKSKAKSELESIRWLIVEHGPYEGKHGFGKWIDGLGRRLGVRITYVAKAGHVVADSDVGFANVGIMDDHSERPEIMAAHIEGEGLNVRYSDTVHKEMLYVAVKVVGSEAVPDGYLRLAVPFSRVSDRLASLRISFFWIFLGTMAFAVVVSMVMSRNMSREIYEFSNLARSIGEGDYGTRLRVVPGSEFMPLAQSINGMAQSIERNVRVIRDQKGQLQAIFEGMREGVMSLDASGRIESFNSALDTMFNLADSSIGRTPIEVTRRFEIQDLVDAIKANPDEGARSIQIELMDRTVELSAVPSLDHQGEAKIILVFHDITEMKRSEKGLKDFVANASHQLRTPLTSIKGYAETLIDNPPSNPEDARFFLETVIKNADHMDKVISSMLALAKSEQMGKQLKLAPVSGREFLNRTVADVTPWAAERGIFFNIHAPVDDMLVMAEPDGLLHVFHNLLNNAVKYSPDNGKITVSAEDDGESIVFCVEDQGPGISREHSTKVFERFYRVDENTIDSSSGSAGLGLAICRRIVRNLGGEIWHDGYGEDIRGARFCFRLNKPEPPA